MGFNKDRFRQAIKDKKLTSQDLVDKLRHKGIKMTLSGIKYYKIKNNNSSPSTKVLSALADILGVTTDYLLGKDLPLQNSQININNVDNKNGSFAGIVGNGNFVNSKNGNVVINNSGKENVEDNMDFDEDVLEICKLLQEYASSKMKQDLKTKLLKIKQFYDNTISLFE